MFVLCARIARAKTAWKRRCLCQSERSQGDCVRWPDNERVACCPAALCLPLLYSSLNARRRHYSLACAMKQHSRLYQMPACPCTHAQIHIHTHTRYHMSRYYKSICLHNQWHLPSQQMPFEQIELPAKLLDSFLWSNKSNINQMPPPPMALANTIKGICTRNKRHLPPQQKAFTFTIKSICLRHSIYSHIYTLTPCMLKRHL